MSSFTTYRTSLQIFLFNKFFYTNISQVELEILRNSTTIFRSSHRRHFIKELFSKILWDSQENTCVGVSFLINLQAISPVTLLKRNSNTDVFLRISINLEGVLFSRTFANGCIFESVLWERFQDQNLAKETTDDLLCQVSQDWAKMFPILKY